MYQRLMADRCLDLVYSMAYQPIMGYLMFKFDDDSLQSFMTSYLIRIIYTIYGFK